MTETSAAMPPDPVPEDTTSSPGTKAGTTQDGTAAATGSGRGKGYETPDCPECDLDAIDDLQCEAQRITKEAEVTAKSSEELGTMRTEFEEARAAYLGARGEAENRLTTIDDQLKGLKSSFECMFNDDDEREIIECLEASYERIKEQLAACGDGATGCCVTADDCDFADEAPPGEIAATIEEYTAKVAKARACFDALKEEPKPLPAETGLPARVKALGDAVAELAHDLCDEEKKGDWKRLYVRLLRLLDDRDAIWRGFASATAFVDCLCLALTCVMKGKKALAKLEGQRAFIACKDSAKVVRCQVLRDNFIAEVMADYERTCGKEPCEPQSGAAA